MQPADDQSKDPYWRSFLFNKGMWFWLASMLLIAIPAAIDMILRQEVTARALLRFFAPLAVLCGILFGAWQRATDARRSWRASTGRCLECGYILYGIELPICPECGFVEKRLSTDVTDAHR